MNARDPGGDELRPLAHWLNAARSELDARVPPPWISVSVSSAMPSPTTSSAPASAPTSAPTSAVASKLPRPTPLPRRWPWQSGAWGLASLAAMSVLVAVFTGSPPAATTHEFVAVAGAERWLRLNGAPGSGQRTESGTAAWLVQTEMPQERLAAFGLPFDPGRAAMPVRTELLMRASGEVLALRILD